MIRRVEGSSPSRHLKEEIMAYKARSLPPLSCRATGWPYALQTEAEAEQVKDNIEIADEHGGMLVVEYDGLFCVVYGPDYVDGFTDYE